nr:MAG TPA: hypothetical protein [Caudoviricetes sp.]
MPIYEWLCRQVIFPLLLKTTICRYMSSYEDL